MRHTNDAELAGAVVTLAEQKNYSMVAYCGIRSLTTRRDYHTDTVLRYNESDLEVVDSLLDVAAAGEIHKMIVFDDPERIPKRRAELFKHLGESVTITGWG